MSVPKYGTVDLKAVEREAKAAVERIVGSDALRIIVVAGPGTGKSALFKTMLSQRDGNCLALTFIRNLKAQLSAELGPLAACYTFHGYCKMLIHANKLADLSPEFKVSRRLEALIGEDAGVLGYGKEEYGPFFQNLVEGPLLDVYLLRGTYYDAVGFNDIVYRVLREFRSGRWTIPHYAQIVVDEYQDFNALEATLIDILARDNRILIVGDDDQAIYKALRNASPSFLRQKATSKEFAFFTLPFCSRCTQVIILAVQDVVRRARAKGLLSERVDKPFQCYWPRKEADSREFPTITHVICSTFSRKANYIGLFIEAELHRYGAQDPTLTTSKELRAMVIGPRRYLTIINEHLATKFLGVSYAKGGRNAPDLLEAYVVLASKEQSNLGWRMVLDFEGAPLRKAVIMESGDGKRPMHAIIDPAVQQKHLRLVRLVKRILNGDPVSEDEIKELGVAVNESPARVAQKARDYKRTDEGEEEEPEEAPSWLRLCTYYGSKGLQADYVFVVGLNEGSMPARPREPTELEACSFIVALTRARKKCYLVSNTMFAGKWAGGPSTLIGWIDSTRIAEVKVDKRSFGSRAAAKDRQRAE